jgi:hypothetical protein
MNIKNIIICIRNIIIFIIINIVINKFEKQILYWKTTYKFNIWFKG